MAGPATYPTMVLDHLMLCSEQPGPMAAFYTRMLQLTCDELKGGCYLCHGPGRRILIGPGEANQLGFAAFALAAPPDLDRLRGLIAAQGVEILDSPTPLFGDRAFAVDDPDGSRLVFGLADGDPAVGDAAADDEDQALSGRLQHVVMRTRGLERLDAFYREVLGFRTSDRVADDTGELTATFLRGNPEHHSFAAFRAPEAGLDHTSFEAADWNAIRDWADHLAARGVAIDWGPGRHGPGNNLFIMFRDPDANWIEISTELERIETDRPVVIWPHGEHALNLWGRGVLRS